MKGFTTEEVNTLKVILYRTWEIIGDDIMTAVQEEGKHSISRNDVVEVVLDADHGSHAARNEKALEVWGKFQELSYKARIAFAKKEVFTASRYS